MASTYSQITVVPPSVPGLPNPVEVDVTITKDDGSSVVAYTARDGSTAFTFPASVSAPTTFYLAAAGTFSVSAKVGAQEVATDGGRPERVFAGSASMTPSVQCVRPADPLTDGAIDLSALAADDAFTSQFLPAAVLGASNGTDDSTAINTTLAASAGLRVAGRPGQAYKISAPLIVKSGTTLDMTGCSVTLNAGSNCNMLQNAAVTAVTTATDGAMTSGSTTLTSATLAAVAAAGQTVIVSAATANSYLLVANVVSVGGGALVLSLPAGRTVSGATVTLYNRNTDIEIVGGTWDRGANAGTGVGLHGLLFRHVDGLKIRNLKLASTAGKYMIAPGDVTNLLVENISGDVLSILCQINGPCSKFVVRNFTGTSGDDGFALTPGDYPTYADVTGDITDGVVENMFVTSTLANGLRVLGGNPDTACRRVSIRNVRGTALLNHLFIGDDTAFAGTTGGLVDEVSWDNCWPATPVGNGQRQVYINGSNIGHIKLRGIRFDNASSSVDSIAVVSGAVIKSVQFEDVTVSNIGASQPVITVAGTVGSLKVNNVEVNVASTVPGNFVNIAGTTTDATVRGLHTTSGVGGYAVAVNGASATATRLSVSDVHMVGGAGLLASQTAGASMPNVELANCTTTGTAWGLGDFVGTTEVHCTNVTAKSPTQGIANVRATAIVTITGDACALAVGSNGVKVTSGGKAAVRLWDCPPSTTAGGLPTIAAGAGAGSSPTVTVAGTDRTGTVSITPGSGAAAGVQGTITFVGTWPQSPRVVLTPTNAAAQAAGGYVSSKGTTSFAISTAGTPGGAMTFDYVTAA